MDAIARCADQPAGAIVDSILKAFATRAWRPGSVSRGYIVDENLTSRVIPSARRGAVHEIPPALPVPAAGDGWCQASMIVGINSRLTMSEPRARSCVVRWQRRIFRPCCVQESRFNDNTKTDLFFGHLAAARARVRRRTRSNGVRVKARPAAYRARAPRRAECPRDSSRRRRVCPVRNVRRRRADAGARQAGRRRPALQPLSHDRPVLADACRDVDGTQCPRVRERIGDRICGRVSRIQRHMAEDGRMRCGSPAAQWLRNCRAGQMAQHPELGKRPERAF